MMINRIIVPEENLYYEVLYSLKVVSKNRFLDGTFFKGKMKIDTGCGISTISVSNIYKDIDSSILKLKDIELYRSGKIEAKRSFGVNDRKLQNSLKKDGKLDLSKCTDDEILNDEKVCFIHKTNDIKLNGLSFGELYFSINYDRPSPSLLGVNFIKNFNSEILKINGFSYFILGNEDNSTLLEKVYNLLKGKVIIKDIISELHKQGYNTQSINNAIVQAVQHTYLDE